MESERTIRNGYMALVVSVSNKLQKRYDGQEKLEDTTVSDYLEEVGEEWRAFVDGELKNSNENNNKTLGGCTTRNNMSEDNEEENSNYDVQMEKIMARFTNFNQILSQTSGNDDDEDEDEDEAADYKEDNDEDKDKKESGANDYDSTKGIKVEPVVIKEPEELSEGYTDNTFWDLNKGKEDEGIDYDALLAELEAWGCSHGLFPW